MTYVFRLGEEAGAGRADAVRAYPVLTAVFGLDALADEIAAGEPTDAASRTG